MGNEKVRGNEVVRGDEKVRTTIRCEGNEKV